MSKVSTLDIIVPVQNEEKNIQPLVDRIDKTFESKRKFYRVIFILDKSIDKTEAEIIRLQRVFPIVLQKKQGIRGKSVSIVEGVALAKSEFVALLDGDLEYPPEALAEMLLKIPEADVVVANRKNHAGGLVRKVGSRTSRFIMSKIFLGQNVDVQSGLKIFRKSLLKYVDLSALKPWSFDFPLLFAALEHGHKIDSVDITYTPRTAGESKVNLWETSKDILWNAGKTVWGANRTHTIEPTSRGSMIGAGVIHKRHEFITHSAIPKEKSALDTFVLWQKVLLIGIIELFIFGLSVSPLTTVIIFLGALTSVYFIDIIFTLVMVTKSLSREPEINSTLEELKKIDPKKLPVYSILCPLYREGNVLPQFVEAMDKFDYPKNKLDILLLLEENDPETIAAAKKLALPSHYRIVVVPHSMPKTKPKACNYGLSLARGEYVVIYDAEDKPDADQLKKAYLGFQKVSSKVVCLQAKLNYYNPSHNLLTRLFTAEYSLWFDVVLPGLQSVNTTIPLGGTSNHFKTKALRDIHGWDAFNVTEDCDLGARLFKEGFQTAIIDSVTLEEANSNPKNWLRQRSRWIKGYFQTFLVHNRHPLEFLRTHGKHALLFQLIIGCRTTFTLINPVLWAMTIAYFTLYRFVGPTIASFYPPVIFYMAVISLVFGNFIYLYNYMIGAAKRGHWSIIKYVFLIPIYWFGVSLAAGIAAWQLFTKPHYWEKTIHGFHLNQAVKTSVVKSTEAKKSRFFGNFQYNFPNIGRSHIAGFLLIGCGMLANFFNFLYISYLTHNLSLPFLGLIGLTSSFLYLSQVPLDALSGAVTVQTGNLFGRLGHPVTLLYYYLRNRVFKSSIIISLLWLISIPLLKTFFNADSVIPFIAFAPVWIISALNAVNTGFLSGNHRFEAIAIAVLTESVVKLALSILLVRLGLPHLVYFATPLSMCIVLITTYLLIKQIKSPNISRQAIRSSFFLPLGFLATSTLGKISGIAFLSLDVILAQHYLPSAEAGQYSIISTVGKMVYLFGSVFLQFIIPVISKLEGANKKTAQAFNYLLGSVIVVSIGTFVVFGLFAKVTTPILWGSKVIPVLDLIPYYALSMVYFTVVQAIVSYHQTKKNYLFSIAAFFISLIQVAGILTFHANLSQVVIINLISSFILIASIYSLHVFDKKLGFVSRNLQDLLGLFSSNLIKEKPASNTDQLRILVFNWRDTRHLWSGGAEVYIHELSKRWVSMGHRVTVFCGNDGKSPRHETIDGVEIVRRGGFYFVYVWAFFYYLFRLRGKFDVVIDSENGIPFFTPFYVGVKKFLLIHHVHQDIFRIHLPIPLSWIGAFLEREVMPIAYHNTPVITVSPSSKADILDHLLTKHEPEIIYNGVDLTKMRPGRKSKNPMVLYLGRIRKAKSLHIFVDSAKKILEKMPTVEFVIAGDGQDEDLIKRQIEKLNLKGKVKMLGKVTEEQKISLYQKAWVFINPSLLEGWGITAIEANACGTPVVASNVPGLRDAVHNPHSGFLVPYGNVDEFADATLELLTDSRLRAKMSKESIDWAKKFDWTKSANEALKLMTL